MPPRVLPNGAKGLRKGRDVIFLSYSRSDKSLVAPLARLLRASGHKVFMDQDDLIAGGDWKCQIEQAIKQSDRFLLFWSKSTKPSPFVTEEWRLALEKPGCIIVPILLDRTPLPQELHRFHGTEDLQPMFQSLLRIRMLKRVLWLVVLPLTLMTCSVPFFLFGRMLAPQGGPKTVPHPVTGPVLAFLGLVVLVVLASVLLVFLVWTRRLYKKIAMDVTM
jgi:hypothetical protein